MSHKQGEPRSSRRVSEKTQGSMKGFASTGKKKPAQFQPDTPGQVERGWRQKTPKTATAAFQGTSMPGRDTEKWLNPPRADARRQFGTPAGKKPFSGNGR